MRVRLDIRRECSRAARLVVASLLLVGCATAPPPAEPEPVKPPVHAPEPPVRAPSPPPQPEPPPPPAAPPAIAVVLTNRSTAYEQVATALAALFEDISIYDLSDKSQPADTAFKLINDSDADAVVFAAAPVIFSQVFNYQDYELLKPTSRGVSAIAPLDAQLRAWKDLQPTLSRVGLVLGPGHDTLIDDAELVLSARVLREMIGQANRRGVAVLVPSRSMLSMGASISVSTVAADIAARIRDIVGEIDDGNLEAVPPITPLTEVLVETNDERLDKATVSVRGGLEERPRN